MLNMFNYREKRIIVEHVQKKPAKSPSWNDTLIIPQIVIFLNIRLKAAPYFAEPVPHTG